MLRPVVVLFLLAGTYSFADEPNPVGEPTQSEAKARDHRDAPASDHAGGDQTERPATNASPQEKPDNGAPLVDRPGRGILTGDEWRYDRHWLLTGLLERIVFDLVAIPSGIVAWKAADWAVFGTVMAVTAALVIPISAPAVAPSLDVKLQRTIVNVLGGADRPKLWTEYGDMIIWMGIWSGVASLFLYGISQHHPEHVEAAALAVEAFAIAQIYTNLIKLFTGREGPNNNIPEGQTVSDGRFGGPPAYVKLFPSGFPSGHIATMYAIFGVAMTYYDNPAVWIGLNMIGIMASVTIITDNYHFASETIFAAAMGFCIGRWVVEHRSSRYRNGGDGLPQRILNVLSERVVFTPMALPNGGMGGALAGTF